MAQRNTPQYQVAEQAQPYMGEYSRLAEQFLKKRNTPVYSIGQGLAEAGGDIAEAYLLKKAAEKEAAKEGKDFSDYAMAQKLAMDPGLAKDPRSGALYSQADFNGLQTQGVDPMNTQQRYSAAVNALAGVNPRMAAAAAPNIMQAAKSVEPPPDEWMVSDKFGIVRKPGNGAQPEVVQAPPRPSQLLTPEEEAQQLRMKRADRAPQAAMTPVEMYEKNIGKLEPGMTAEVVDGKLTGRQIPIPGASKDPAVIERQKTAAMAAEAPAQQQSLATTLSFYDKVINAIDSIENNPDTKDVVGSIQGRSLFPNQLGGDNNQAITDIDNLKDMLQVQGLQIMRDTSKTGGAVGSITEREWPKLSARFGNLARTQREEDFGKSLQTIKAEFKDSRQRVIDAYNNAYGDIAGRYEDKKQTGASGSWGQDVDALLNKYDPPR